MAVEMNPKAIRVSPKSLKSRVGSALIGFTQSGAGAAFRKVQDKLRETVSVLDFIPLSEHAAIAAGTSTYDCRTGIRAAIAASNRLLFPPGTYYVSCLGGADPSAGPGLDLNQKTDVFWSGYGATIKATADSVATGYSWLLRMRLNNRVVIEGLTFDGNRDNRTGSFNSGSHCISYAGGDDHVFRDVTLKNSTYDGILVWANNTAVESQYPHRALFDNVVCDNCYRNGMSIVGGVDITVRGGRFINTNGTLPEAGIDIESDSGDAVGTINITVEGAEFSDNAGAGLEITGNVTPYAENVRVRNIWGSNNGDCLLNIVYAKGVYVEGVDVSGDTTDPSKSGLVFVSQVAQDVHLRNLNFRGLSGITKACIYVENTSPAVITIEGVKASDVPCRTLHVLSPAHISNVSIDDDTSTTDSILLHTLAVGSSLRNVTVKGKTASQPAIRAQASYTTLENIKLYDCKLGVRMEGANNKYHNIEVYNSGTSANYAYYMDTATGVIIENVNAKDVGGYWTNSTAFSFDAGLTSLAGARIRNVYPSPLMGSATWDPASIANNASATTTVSVTRADIGDTVRVGHSVSLAGLTSTAYVSAANTVTVVLSNNTGGAVDLASHTVTVECVK